MRKKPFEVVSLVVGSLQTNCYLICDTITSDTLIIDPGDDAFYIENIISDKRFHPTTIIATHGHFDHILGVTELQLAYRIPFLIHKKDHFLVSHMQSSAKHFLKIDVDPTPRIDRECIGGEKITIGKTSFSLIETPGHTLGSICLYQKKEGILFTGDLLFAEGGMGRTDFSYSDKNHLDESLAKIFRLPEKTIIYPGHGKLSTLRKERPYHSVIPKQ